MVFYEMYGVTAVVVVVSFSLFWVTANILNNTKFGSGKISAVVDAGFRFSH